jgi:catechol 2,3-dioxygenase-like lactoylglutathione lyase family enzyme
MDLGWLDVCLRVKDVAASRAFYEALGFRRVEGADSEGWGVVVNGEARIGLFQPQFMEEETFSLNFRGGDVMAIAKDLQDRGLAFEKGPAAGREGGASAVLKDPDGHTLLFDTAPGEVKRV